MLLLGSAEAQGCASRFYGTELATFDASTVAAHGTRILECEVVLAAPLGRVVWARQIASFARAPHKILVVRALCFSGSINDGGGDDGTEKGGHQRSSYNSSSSHRRKAILVVGVRVRRF